MSARNMVSDFNKYLEMLKEHAIITNFESSSVGKESCCHIWRLMLPDNETVTLNYCGKERNVSVATIKNTKNRDFIEKLISCAQIIAAGKIKD